MSRRGRSGPAISLFSFQDIITSVTAIVTVITLLLALDLVQRKQSQAGNSSAALAAELSHRLETARADLANLSAEVSSVDDVVQQAAAISPAELELDIARRESAIHDLQNAQTRLEKEQDEWKGRLKTVEIERFELEPSRKKTRKLVQETSDLERRRKAEEAENRTIFSLPRGFQKEGWIAVVESQRILVAPLGRSAVPRAFETSGVPLFGISAADEFLKWIELERLRTAYFLLQVRPDGPGVFESVQERFTKQNIAYGFDLIGANEVLLDSERGAAP
jgi:hypothetical protein